MQFRRPQPRFVYLLSLTAFALGGFFRHVDAQEPEPAKPNRFEKDIAAFEEQDRQQPPAAGVTVFIGSSSIRMWNLGKSFPGASVINRGFGGSQLADSVHFAPRIVVPYKPAKVVLYAGDNDLNAGKTPQEVFADYQAFVELVHEKLPRTEVIYIGIKPSLSRWKLIEQVRETNRLIRDFGKDRPWLKFIDVEPPMLGPDGLPRKELFRMDGLHMTDAGYKIWNGLVKPLLPSS